MDGHTPTPRVSVKTYGQSVFISTAVGEHNRLHLPLTVNFIKDHKITKISFATHVLLPLFWLHLRTRSMTQQRANIQYSQRRGASSFVLNSLKVQRLFNRIWSTFLGRDYLPQDPCSQQAKHVSETPLPSVSQVRFHCHLIRSV